MSSGGLIGVDGIFIILQPSPFSGRAFYLTERGFFCIVKYFFYTDCKIVSDLFETFGVISY